MSLTRELIDQEALMVQGGERGVIHLHREGSFYRSYEWSAYLSCRYLHEFKVNKRAFNGIEQPVAYIGFPETSLNKWMPEGAELKEIEEKHLTIRLPDVMLQNDSPDVLDAAFLAWKDAIPLNENKGEKKKKEQQLHSDDDGKRLTLTGIMQRVLAYPIESKSPLESMLFLADIKRQLAELI